MLHFKDKLAKEYFLGQLYEKDNTLAELVQEKKKVWIVNLSSGEVILNEREFRRQWNKIKEVADLFNLRAVAADIFQHHWELTKLGKKLKPESASMLFGIEEWKLLEACLK